MSNRAFAISLAVLTVAGFAWFNWITYTQYRANLVFLADAGIFDFLCAGPRHGNFLRYPLAWDTDANYFAAHFRPIFFVIMPFYFIVDHMMTYLSVQNAVLVAAVVPLCLYARTIIGSNLLALLVGGLYLTNHFIRSIHLANHPESMAFLGFFAMFLAAERRWTWMYIAGFLWAATVKEDMAIWLGAFGVALLLEKDPWKRKAALWTIPAAIAMWVIAMLTMKLAGADAMHEAGVKPLSRFADMGETKPEVIVYMITHPLEIAGRILRWPLLILFASVGFVALLDWRAAWLVVPAAGVFMMTDDYLVRELSYYYSYPAIPFLFYSTVRGIRVLHNYLEQRRPEDMRIAPLLLIGVIVASLPLRTRTDNYRHLPFRVTDNHRLADRIIEMIPPQVPVAAQFDLYAKVPNRPVKLPMRLDTLPDIDYVIYNFGPTGRPVDLLGEEMEEEVEEMMDIIHSDEFEIVFAGDGYVLMRRARENTNLP